ncbi:AraC family transcriptional regulator [Mycobacterium sp. NPDC050551]|uniref:AraC family transcriptional regulator n=1 Tax=Mycobacterium sp. NPDC050551 TaxID=3155407 RepID=UPI0034401928
MGTPDTAGTAPGPVEELLALLRPEAVLSKVIDGAGSWGVRKPRYGDPAFCVMLQGTCVLEADGLDAIDLHDGDFLLLPETPGFTLSASRGVEPVPTPLDHGRRTRHGGASEPVTMRMLGGYFRVDPTNGPLLVPLLPPAVLVRRDEPGSARLSRIVELIAEEADGESPCRETILQRLVEVLLMEAIRIAPTPVDGEQRGLIAGLSDSVLAPALTQLHADLARGWTVQHLARAASVSRAVFAQRFADIVGMPPMQYVLQWRLATARELLRSGRLSTAQIAQRVGYQSPTAFSTAFARHTGCTPTEYARRMQRDGRPD